MRTEKIEQKTIIFNCLRNNSRQKLMDISKNTNIPVSTIFDTLKRLNDSINKYTIIPNYSKLGFNTRALIILEPENSEKEKMINYLTNINTINSIFNVDGNGFFIDVILKDNKQLSNFIKDLEKKFKINNFKIHLVLDEMKHEDFILNS